ncbi:Protein prune like protein 2 [Chelonia mydas]|uniref:Protein prune like protein 2 n=1 Tax=Chelonia mydas TaxID=8469 RepID=M7B076_CHEMY|nr:Protein prune like protein 2 [Chelonia mydas]
MEPALQVPLAKRSDDKSLESAVVKVINPDERCDANLGLQASSSSLVVKEILQEAPELITQQLAHLLRGSILFKCMSMEPERITEQQEEILSILEEKFPELPPREDIISVFQETPFKAQGLNIEEAMLKDLKELSDGEIKVAVSTVYMTLELLGGADAIGVLGAGWNCPAGQVLSVGPLNATSSIFKEKKNNIKRDFSRRLKEAS